MGKVILAETGYSLNKAIVKNKGSKLMGEEKETTFYSDERGVRITNTRAIVGATTYAMANITSVSTAVKPANRTPGIVVAILGLLVLVITGLLGSSGGVIFGVIFLGLGILVAVIAKATYVVRIGSASGEADAISSKDEKYIQAIVQAMNEAFIKRR